MSRETEDPDGCPRDGGRDGSRRIETDVPRRRFQRMPLGRRIETDAPKTEDRDGCP